MGDAGSSLGEENVVSWLTGTKKRSGEEQAVRDTFCGLWSCAQQCFHGHRAMLPRSPRVSFRCRYIAECS